MYWMVVALEVEKLSNIYGAGSYISDFSLLPWEKH